jgi:23S rRNA pseudouridine1911/1915/1917 synthase
VRIPITEAEAGARLDKLIVQKVPGLGRAGAKRLFAEGRVRVLAGGEGYGHRAAKGDVAVAGDGIELDLMASEAGSGAVPDPEAPLHLVLETAQLVVVDKPAGQATAPLDPGERGSVANALVARYPEMAGVGFSPREPGLCHRLDTGTSGLVLAARSEEAFTTLTTALKEGRLDKRYLVICAAEGLPESGSIDFPLAPHPKDRRRVYPCIHPRDVVRYAPRPATTTYQRLREHEGLALVEVRAPKAARHQIRAHFAAIDHPLLGDALYGGPPLPGVEASVAEGAEAGAAEGAEARETARHALHAHLIVWKGDKSVPAFTAESPLPPELARLLE